MSGEIHQYDVTSNADINQTPTVLLLNGMAAGPGAEARVGNKIWMKTVEWRLWLSNEAGTLQRTPVRMAIVYDRQVNGVAATMAAVFGANPLLSLRDVSQVDRYDILLDETIDYDSRGSSVAGAGNVQMVLHGVLELGRLRTLYGSSAAGIGSIATGALYVMFMGNNVAGVTDLDAYIHCRLDYIA